MELRDPGWAWTDVAAPSEAELTAPLGYQCLGDPRVANVDQQMLNPGRIGVSVRTVGKRS
jgi:hypothetical protein